MNPTEAVCSGIKHGKRCSKLIGNDAVFCLDCGPGHNDSLPVPLSSCVLKNESREERNISESEDDETLNDKWILNEELDSPRAVDVSTTSLVTSRCTNCEQKINTNQLFCDKCGFKLGSVCVGEVNGNPCSKFISVETKFCANCGTANTGNSSVIKSPVLKKKCKSCGYDIETNQKFCNNCGYKIGGLCLGKTKGDPCTKFLSNETKCCSNCGTANPDYITVSVKYHKEQAKEASTSSERYEENAADWIHTDDDTCNIARTKSKDSTRCKDKTPRDESNMELMVLEVTKKLPIDGLMFADGNEDELGDSLQNLPGDDESIEGKKDFLIKVLEEIKDSDEEKIGDISTTADNPEETFEVIASKGSIIQDIRTQLNMYGVIATRNYLMEQATKWKRAKVKIAVAGQSAAGKSAFINAIRGVVFTDEGYAKEGFGDTTMNIEEYVHPKNKQIIYCDLPGYGTTTITRETFLEKVIISDYDMFIIFFSTVPTTDDEWLICQLQEAKIPFCFVRTKLDQDIENGKRMGKSEKTVTADIVNTINRATESFPALKDQPKFIISNYKPSIGDMSKLVRFMQERVTKIKCEAILFSMPALTKEIIEYKYRHLLGRTSAYAIMFALFDRLKPTIEVEIRTYFRVFELNTVYATEVPGLKHYFSEKCCAKLIDDLQNKTTGALWIKTYAMCKNYLTNLLHELKMDAGTMYEHITKNV